MGEKQYFSGKISVEAREMLERLRYDYEANRTRTIIETVEEAIWCLAEKHGLTDQNI